MSFDEFKRHVDRRFLEAWLDTLGDRLDSVPNTPDGRQIASFVCQMAVMAQLQERGLIGSGSDAHERAGDFAMEAVARLWPMFPVGVRSDLDLDMAEIVAYVDWESDDSVFLNLRTAAARGAFRERLRARLREFPSLSDEDREAVLQKAPSVMALDPLCSDDERRIAERVPSSLVVDLQRRALTAKLQGSPRPPASGLPELDLFSGLSAPAFAQVRDGADWFVPLLLAHRAQFSEPPRECHRDAVEQTVDDWSAGPERDDLEGLTAGGRTDLERCLWRLTFGSSYEAARQLLLSASFLSSASGRDACDREASGFHFWHDLRTPRAAELSAALLTYLDWFLVESLPWWTVNDRAELLGHSPLCIFLELLHLGDVPDVPIQVAADTATVSKSPSGVEVIAGGTLAWDDRAKPTRAPEAVAAPGGPATYEGERNVRVFVSSTFRDMQKERDQLAKFVFPQLRRLCQDRGVTWSYVDLRWGITEAQAERGEVLPICLREIERCRPYFIGLLGERYGWVPSQVPQEMVDRYSWLAGVARHQSLTELEIVHGALNDPEMAGRTFFYFRDPAYAQSLPDEERGDFVETDPEQKERLRELKERIRDSGLLLREGFKDASDLGRMVLDDLTSAIEDEFPPHSAPDPLQQIATAHETFARSRAGVYISRREYLERLDAHAGEEGPPLVLLGDSGMGKSALLANWALGMRSDDPDAHVIMHFTAADAASARWDTLVRNVMWQLKRSVGLGMDIPESLNELREALPQWLGAAAAAVAERGGRVILLLDGLDQLEDREGAQDLVWLPQVLPPGVHLIVSALPGKPLEELRRRGWPVLTVAPLEPEERTRLVVEYLQQYGRQLDPAQVARLCAPPQAANPLYVRVLLDELVLFGVYEQLDTRIDHYLSADSVEGLYGLLLARCERDYQGKVPGLVGDTLALLWAARRGLAEAEILDMLGGDGTALPRALWSPFYLSIESAFVSHSGLLTFSHAHLRHAVESRYLTGPTARDAVHRRIADYFDGRAIDRRQLDELPWQLLQSGHPERLAQRLAEPAFLSALWSHDKHSARACWAAIEATSSIRMEAVYDDVLSSPEDHRESLDAVAVLMTEAGRLEAGCRLSLAEAQAFEAEGDELNAAGCLQRTGIALLELGRSDEALATLRRAEATFRRSSYWRGVSLVLGPIGEILRQGGRLEEAERLLLEQERILVELGDRSGLTGCLNNRALVRRDLGDMDGALELYARSEQLGRELGDPGAVATSIGNQATLELMRHRPESALELLCRAEQTSREYGLRIGLMACLLNQAVARRMKGELDESLAILAEHERLCEETGSRLGLAQNLGNRAHVSRIRRQFDEALELYGRSKDICEEVGHLSGVESALGNIASVFEDRMDLEGALRVRREEEAVCRRMKNPHLLALCLSRTAQLLGVPMGRPSEAKPMVEEAERLASGLGIEHLTEEVDRARADIAMASMFEGHQAPPAMSGRRGPGDVIAGTGARAVAADEGQTPPTTSSVGDAKAGVKCSHCGLVNSPGASWCHSCGRDLEAGA